jgi:plastocyanin
MRRLAPLFMAILLAGCAGDTTPVPAARNDVAITIRDFRYSPQDVRVARGRVTFRVVNRGRLPHNFNIRRPKAESEFFKMSTLLPGRSTQASVRLKPGEYRMYCSIGNHEELGEWGTLVVRR